MKITYLSHFYNQFKKNVQNYGSPENDTIPYVFFSGAQVLPASGPGRSCLSGLMMIRKGTLAALTMRENGDHQSVRVEGEEVRIGVMMEVTNAGKRRKLILKTFIKAPVGSKMVLKTT